MNESVIPCEIELVTEFDTELVFDIPSECALFTLPLIFKPTPNGPITPANNPPPKVVPFESL